MPQGKKGNLHKIVVLAAFTVLIFTFPFLVACIGEFSASFGFAVGSIMQAACIVGLFLLLIVCWRRKGKKRFPFIVLLLAVVLASFICGFSVLNVNSKPQRLVGAYYYGWYNPYNWDNSMTHHSDRPLLGCYNSEDVSVITQHIEWAQGSGVDFFVVSVFTDDLASRTKIFEVNKNLVDPIRLAVMIEPRSEAELATLVEVAYEFSLNDFYLEWQGKPLLFVYTQYMSQFDGFSDDRFTLKFVPTEVPYCVENIQSYGISDVVSVCPGGNISYLQIDRLGGDYYRKQWGFALAWSRVNSQRSLMVLVTSWNEWVEDTAIEPGGSWGFLYLDLTRQYSAEFRGVGVE